MAVPLAGRLVYVVVQIRFDIFSVLLCILGRFYVIRSRFTGFQYEFDPISDFDLFVFENLFQHAFQISAKPEPVNVASREAIAS